MPAEPTIEDFKSSDAISIRLQIKRDDMRREMPLAIGELKAAIAAQGLEITGPLFAHHLTTSSERFDMNVGFPLQGTFAPTGRVTSAILPEARVAHATYAGAYEGLFEVWDEFGGWMRKSGYQGSGSILEIYTEGPETDSNPENWKTDLYVFLKG